MCDFSLHAIRSRPAKVGDKLTTRLFHMGTTGFCAPEDERMAVCLLPGTELSFAEPMTLGQQVALRAPGNRLQDCDLQTDQ
jgi:hypothetical protein